MEKILCPTNFSDTALNAISYAAKLAQKLNGEITLLNVQSMFEVSPGELVRGKAMSIAAVKDLLEEQSREVTKTFKVSCYADVEPSFSTLSSVIHKKAQNFNLIVMGSDGPDDLYQFFFGSNTYNAIVKSDIPVLIVPGGYLYSDINTMVFAFDYLKERDIPLSHLIPIIKALKCELIVLQVIEAGYSKEAQANLKELQYTLKNFYGDDVNFSYDTIHSKDIARSIDKYFSTNRPDALALCSVHRNLLENIFHTSVIKYISAVCNYPVLVFHQ